MENTVTEELSGINATELATELTIAWLSNPNTRVDADQVPDFLQKMHDAVTALASTNTSVADERADVEHTPAVTVRKSLSSPDHIISLIDGKPYRLC